MNFLFFFINLIWFMVNCSPDAIKSRIAIIGAHDYKYDSIGKWAHLNKASYAQKHGYDFFLYSESLDPTRLGYWNKIIAIKNHLKDYDWIFWLDSDALIINFDIKLENLIDEEFDFITTRDHFDLDSINSGQFLIKNCDWSFNFLNAWYSLNHIQKQPGFDNGALKILVNEFESIRPRVKIIPLRMLSSYVSKFSIYLREYQQYSIPIDNLYQDGDFIIHLAGFSHNERIELMEKIYYVICYRSNDLKSVLEAYDLFYKYKT